MFKVVCKENRNWYVGNGPKKDEIVTVKSIWQDDMYVLVEYGDDVAFNICYFRPLDDTFSSDICAAIEEEMAPLTELIEKRIEEFEKLKTKI